MKILLTLFLLSLSNFVYSHNSFGDNPHTGLYTFPRSYTNTGYHQHCAISPGRHGACTVSIYTQSSPFGGLPYCISLVECRVILRAKLEGEREEEPLRRVLDSGSFSQTYANCRWRRYSERPNFELDCTLFRCAVYGNDYADMAARVPYNLGNSSRYVSHNFRNGVFSWVYYSRYSQWYRHGGHYASALSDFLNSTCGRTENCEFPRTRSAGITEEMVISPDIVVGLTLSSAAVTKPRGFYSCFAAFPAHRPPYPPTPGGILDTSCLPGYGIPSTRTANQIKSDIRYNLTNLTAVNLFLDGPECGIDIDYSKVCLRKLWYCGYAQNPDVEFE